MKLAPARFLPSTVNVFVVPRWSPVGRTLETVGGMTVSASCAPTGKLCTIVVKQKSVKAMKENKATVFLFTGGTSLPTGIASTRNQRVQDVVYSSEAFTNGSSGSWLRLAASRQQLPVIGQVVDAQRPVIATCGQSLAIGANRKSFHPIRLVGKHSDRVQRCRIAHADRPVGRASDDFFSVRRPYELENGVLIGYQGRG